MFVGLSRLGQARFLSFFSDIDFVAASKPAPRRPRAPVTQVAAAVVDPSVETGAAVTDFTPLVEAIAVVSAATAFVEGAVAAVAAAVDPLGEAAVDGFMCE